VLRDEIVVEIWSTCREPVDDDPNSLLILKQALDNINLSDEDKAYVMAGDWGFIPKIQSSRIPALRQGVRAVSCKIDGGATGT
jgi:hypothetical protein